MRKRGNRPAFALRANGGQASSLCSSFVLDLGAS
jgi:hypothetical protein